MKRIICLVCIMAALSAFCGCSHAAGNYTRPVNVYYCAASVDYRSADGLFAKEVRDYYGWSERLLDFLNVYLAGPLKSDLVSPFPAGSKVNSLHTNGTSINVQLNASFSGLSSNELTLACACLSMTVLDITGAENVNIQIEGLGDGNTNITMTRENMHITDLTVPEE